MARALRTARQQGGWLTSRRLGLLLAVAGLAAAMVWNASVNGPQQAQAQQQQQGGVAVQQEQQKVEQQVRPACAALSPAAGTHRPARPPAGALPCPQEEPARTPSARKSGASAIERWTSLTATDLLPTKAADPAPEAAAAGGTAAGGEAPALGDPFGGAAAAADAGGATPSKAGAVGAPGRRESHCCVRIAAGQGGRHALLHIPERCRGVSERIPPPRCPALPCSAGGRRALPAAEPRAL